MSKLSLFDICIIGKYFITSNDFINLIKVSKKYRELCDVYHYNPIREYKMFPNINTLYIYDINDYNITTLCYNNVVFLCEINYSDIQYYKQMYKHIVFKNIVYDILDFDKFKSTNDVKITKVKQSCFKTKFDIYDYMNKYYCGNTKLSIPEGIKSLGQLSFSNQNLFSVKIPESVKILGIGCFANCINLKVVEIESNITKIPSNCFTNCIKLIGLITKCELKYLGNSSFYDCKNLEYLNMSFDAYIGTNCFYNCEKLKK